MRCLFLHDGQEMMTIPFSYARLVKVCELRCPHLCTGGDSGMAPAPEELEGALVVAMGAVHVNVRDKRGSITGSSDEVELESEDEAVEAEVGDAMRVGTTPEKSLRRKL